MSQVVTDAIASSDGIDLVAFNSFSFVFFLNLLFFFTDITFRYLVTDSIA
ncbi:hypothetical protein IIC38_07290 [candidate division KSB1 bacterium]|nr:hypothetical protein [candidate division KSB1 bacterium]